MRFIRSLFRFLWKAIAIAFLILILGISIVYINTTIYNFPEPKAFSGNEIYNPYENLPDSSYRANFHAHSIAWKTVTNGHNTEKDLYDGYTEKGYDIVGISNYHKISDYAESRTDLYVPVYEHGYNIFKSHYLALNPDEPSYFDYPLYQTTSHQQKIIENLRAKNAIVAMAHPKFGGGRSFDNMKALVNYDFTEVLNHYRVSDEYWDEALSAGRLTWVMGNDDTHDIVNEPTYLIWNVIYSKHRNVDSILTSMLAGKNYAVKSLNGTLDNSLVSCVKNDSNSFTVEFENEVSSIEFIGQNGKVMQITSNAKSGKYTFNEGDSYIRVVAKNNNSSIYLNPIVRYNGSTVPMNTLLKAEPNSMKTWIFRIVLILISLSLLILMRKIIRR